MYLVFGFDDYYPSGGWSDLISRHETLEEAVEAVSDRKTRENYQIVDYYSLIMVKEISKLEY